MGTNTHNRLIGHSMGSALFRDGSLQRVRLVPT
jgi:hypothetical protein